MKKTIGAGVEFLRVSKSSFKSQEISVAVFVPLKAETASQNAVLPGLLTRSCEKFPDFTNFKKKLADLYDLSISSSVSKLGDSQVLCLSATSISESFALFSEEILNPTTDFLCELLFRPKLSGNAFSIEDFEHEKKELVENIESNYNNKAYYAKEKCVEHMCENENYRISEFGKKENAENLTSDATYLAWKDALEKAKIQIVSVGHDNSNEIAAKFEEEFSKINRNKFFNYENNIIRQSKTQKEKSESQSIRQAKLVIGFRTGITVNDKLANACHIMSLVFGGTVGSKLFLNVREKLGLCYYCKSSFNDKKGIMFVESGVYEKNIEKAKEEILRQLEDIKKANFTDQDLSRAKFIFKNSLYSIEDSPGLVSNFFINQFFNEDKKTLSEFAEKISKVTKEEVVEAAKFVTLDTVFTLTPEKKVI